MSALLVGSGIRHLRDGRPTTDGGYLGRLAYLGQHGIKHNIGFSISDGSALVSSELQKQMPYVDFIEPANEYDGYKNSDPNWVANLRAQQQVLFDTRNGDLAFAGVGVVGPAMTSLVDYGALGSFDSAEDAGNLHFATCSLNPGNTAGSGHSSFAYAETFAHMSTVSKSMWTTETGYNSQVGIRPCALPDEIVAKYDPRMIAERFNGGDGRMYFYQLVDMPADPVFGGTGLISETGVAKPQFTAVASLLNMLADPGPSFTTTPLSYAVTAPADVHHTLLQKQNGTYELLLWREAAGWQSTTSNIGGVPIVVPPTTIALTVPGASALRYYSYDASWALQPHGFARSSAHTYELTVTDAISILELH